MVSSVSFRGRGADCSDMSRTVVSLDLGKSRNEMLLGAWGSGGVIGLARSWDEEADAEDEDLETKSSLSCCGGMCGWSCSLSQLVEFGAVGLASWPSIDKGSGNTDGDKSRSLGDGGLYWAMDWPGGLIFSISADAGVIMVSLCCVPAAAAATSGEESGDQALGSKLSGWVPLRRLFPSACLGLWSTLPW